MAVKKNKNGVWYFKTTVTDEFGRTKQVKRESRNWNKNDAKIEEAKLLQDNTMDSTMLFSKLANMFFEHQALSVKAITIRTAKCKYKNQVEPYFGMIRIDQIDNKMIMNWHRVLIDKGYSNSILDNSQGIFKSMLEYGVKCNFLLKNPYTIGHVRNKQETKKEVEVITINDFNKFLDVIESEEHQALYKLLFWVGLRIGEALALQYNDIDFDNNIVRVSKTYNEKDRICTSPKTRQSNRSIKFNHIVKDALFKQYTKYKRGYMFSGEEYVFGYCQGYPYSSVTYWHKRYISLSGLSYFKIHSLRHSCVSVLISMGVKPLQIAKRMGHSVNMVNTVYGHLFQDDDQLIVDQQDILQSNVETKRTKNIN